MFIFQKAGREFFTCPSPPKKVFDFKLRHYPEFAPVVVGHIQRAAGQIEQQAHEHKHKSKPPLRNNSQRRPTRNQ